LAELLNTVVLFGQTGLITVWEIYETYP